MVICSRPATGRIPCTGRTVRWSSRLARAVPSCPESSPPGLFTRVIPRSPRMLAAPDSWVFAGDRGGRGGALRQPGARGSPVRVVGWPRPVASSAAAVCPRPSALGAGLLVRAARPSRLSPGVSRARAARLRRRRAGRSPRTPLPLTARTPRSRSIGMIWPIGLSSPRSASSSAHLSGASASMTESRPAGVRVALRASRRARRARPGPRIASGRPPLCGGVAAVPVDQ